MSFIGRVAQGASVLLFLIIGTVLADDPKKATWEKCSKLNNETQILGALPDLQIQELFLADCQLTTLQPGDFDGLPNLDKLSLENNNLTSVDTIVFKDLNKLTSLFLFDNQLTELPNFGEHPEVLTKLELFQIGNNQIQKFDNPKSLSTLTALLTFAASENGLEYIHEDMFKNTPLSTIYLNGNKLSYIPEKLFQIETLSSLYLDNNMIEYIPKDSFLGSAMEELHIQGNKLTYLQGDFLSQFPDGKLTSFRFENNSWKCSYLRELLLDVTRVGITDYNPGYYNGTRIMCAHSELKTLETITTPH